MLLWIIPAVGVAAIGLASLARWIEKRKLRYKRHEILDFGSVVTSARTGDILLFHKTNRSGLLDTLELDVLSPLLFDENEFRHSGIILRENGQIFVVECADEFHSGYADARYLTAGNGIRLVPLETLLDAYNRDNGDPHFGIRHISREIPPQQVYATLEQYGSIDYLKVHKSACVFLSHLLLPEPLHQRVLDRFRNEMMCSEFVHSLLNRCGVLKDYPSKVFAPYYLEDPAVFKALEIVQYSDIVRFNYSGSGSPRGSTA
jgi:hypothetical protein